MDHSISAGTLEILLYCQKAAMDHRETNGHGVAIKSYLQKQAVSRIWFAGRWFADPSQL